MTTWPRNESSTGRGFTQGSDSYRADDVAREEWERAKMADARAKAGQVPCPQDCA